MIPRTLAGKLALSLLTAATIGFAVAAAAAEYPVKPIRLLVGQAAGGGTDLLARAIAEKMREALKQPVVTDDRPGAAGMIASKLTAEAPSDGYTLLIAGMSSTVSPSLYRSVPYDPVRGLQPVAPLMSFPFVIVTHPRVPVATLKEFIDYVKKNAATLNVASAGATTTVTAELFAQMVGVRFTFIPYNGSAPAVTSVISGQTQALFSDLPSAIQHVKSGALRAIAVSGAKRFPQAPDIPTAKESGLPDYVVTSWYGFFAPAKTPAEVVKKLNAALNAIVVQPDVVARLAGMGGEPYTGTTQAFSDLYQSDLKRWKRVITQGKIPLIE